MTVDRKGNLNFSVSLILVKCLTSLSLVICPNCKIWREIFSLFVVTPVLGLRLCSEGFPKPLVTNQLLCHRLLTVSLFGITARVKSKGNFTKTTRDRRVEILEDHHGCIKNLHFGNQVGDCFRTEIMAERVQGGRWA